MPATLHKAIVERARVLGLNATQLARETGVVSQAQLYRYFAGDSDLTGTRLDAVLNVLGLGLTVRKRTRRTS